MEFIIINRKNMALMVDIIDPIDLRVFQVVNLSWKSAYRRGNPANPRKCCGKNVRLTPMNVVQKWIFL